MISLLIIYFLIFTYFTGFSVLCLKIQIKSRKIPLHFNSRVALNELFVQFRETRDLESIMRILNLKTFDAVPAYIDSCVSMSISDYQFIIEHCFMNGKDMKMLSKLLPGDCVMAMNESYFIDSTMAFSLRDLPVSPLSCKLGTFNMRKISLAKAYRGIVFKAVDSKATDIDWNNLIKSPSDLNQLSLSEAFDGFIHAKTKSRLFYYLRPQMLHFVTSKKFSDILWLINAVLPTMPTLSLNLDFVTYLDPKILSYWTEQIFRTVSSFSFYFELHSFDQTFLHTNCLNFDSSDPLIIVEAKMNAMKRFKAFNGVVRKILNLKPRCPPLERILNILNDLHNLFFEEKFLIRNNFVNNLYMRIFERFKNYSHPSIQGDWMLNLFTLFWEKIKSKSSLNHEYLRLAEIRNSILLFFSRNPTVKAIYNAHILFESSFGNNVNAGRIDSFESLIPNNRILEVYKEQCKVLTTRYRIIPFSIRYQLAISDARNIVNRTGKKKYRAKTFLAFPYPSLSNSAPISEKTNLNYQNELINVLKSTISAHYSPSKSIIYAYAPFKLIENDSERPVDFAFFIKQFFNLILNIPQFRILVESPGSNSSRPVIVITPLITKTLANHFGQFLALSVIFEVEVPFIMLKEQFSSMFVKDKENEYNDLNLMIRNFVLDSPIHLKLLNYEIDTLNFIDSISNYFKHFHSWSSLLYSSNLKITEDQNSFIDKAFTNCNYQILSGLKLYFNNSKFTINEIYNMVFN